MKTVLVTGVGKGIGKALAEKFLKEGYFVIGTTFSNESSLNSEHLKTFYLDLGDKESIEKCTDEIKSFGRKIDIHINCAGVLLDEEETTIKRNLLEKTLNINLVGTIDFTERLLSIIENGGHIINISSSASSLEEVGKSSHHIGYYPGYKISKTAINMYTRILALRLKGSHTVSSVHPGWVKTDMGGDEADITPEEAAENIFSLAISKPETGGFWFKGERFPW